MRTAFMSKRILAGLALTAGAALALAGCAAGAPSGSTAGETETVVVGSQAYYSNEIIAEIYAQALEGSGFEVDRQFNVGQRDAYIPLLVSGQIDVFPEYSGNLLQYFDPETTARTTDEVFAALPDALPAELVVLDQSAATDQDSYTVTAAFAAEHDLATIADLAGVDAPLTLGGPPELAERPYGPTGLEGLYGVTVGFTPTGDTTVEDLLAGTVQVANVYTADPRIQTENLVVLDDPKGLFLASHVVPVVGAGVADRIADIINAVSAALTPDGLVALNVLSTVEQRSTSDIAAQWLSEHGLG